MADIYLAIRILFLIAFVVFGNIFYLLIHNILTEKGINVSFFKSHFNHLHDFSLLIKRTENKREQKYFRNILRGFYGVLICFACTAFTFIVDIMDSPCRMYDDLKERAINGVVVRKYINHSHHNMSTLVLDINGELRDQTFLSLHYHGLYDSARIGDFVTKLKGDSIVYLIRGEDSSVFLVPKQRFCDEN
jgi:hypothetical protein